MTPFQPEASAKPPCTSTIVGLALGVLSSATAAAEPAEVRNVAVAAAAPVAITLRRVNEGRSDMRELPGQRTGTGMSRAGGVPPPRGGGTRGF